MSEACSTNIRSGDVGSKSIHELHVITQEQGIFINCFSPTSEEDGEDFTGVVVALPLVDPCLTGKNDRKGEDWLRLLRLPALSSELTPTVASPSRGVASAGEVDDKFSTVIEPDSRDASIDSTSSVEGWM